MSIFNRTSWKELAGRSVVAGHATAEKLRETQAELEREQKRSALVLELLQNDSIDPRIRVARAKTIMKLTENVRS